MTGSPCTLANLTNKAWSYLVRKSSYRGVVSTNPAIRAIAALDDDLRRGMYAFIRAARRPVTRDEAAAAVGISRKLAAFHLDKLVDAGALRARYQAAGRVGRAPKVYEPPEADL